MANRSLLTKRRVSDAIKYAIIAVILLILLFPFFFMLMKSLMSLNDAMELPVRFFPSVLYFKNYSDLFDLDMLLWLKNTMVIIVINEIAGPLSTSFVAYGFSKVKFPGKKIFFTVMMSTVLLPGIVLSIPMYVIYTMLGWTNSILPLVVPSFFGGGAMSIFLYVQFMRGISNEIISAGMVDGAGPFRRYFVLTLPLCRSIIIYQMVTIFMGLWNDYMGPLIYLNEPEQYTLGLGIYYRYIRQSIVGVDTNVGPKMASGVVFSIPPAVLFFVFQKQLIDGINMGGVKE